MKSGGDPGSGAILATMIAGAIGTSLAAAGSGDSGLGPLLPFASMLSTGAGMGALSGGATMPGLGQATNFSGGGGMGAPMTMNSAISNPVSGFTPQGFGQPAGVNLSGAFGGAPSLGGTGASNNPFQDAILNLLKPPSTWDQMKAPLITAGIGTLPKLLGGALEQGPPEPRNAYYRPGTPENQASRSNMQRLSKLRATRKKIQQMRGVA